MRGTPAPPRGVITLPLGRSPEDRRRVVVTSAGQHCHTAYEVLSSANGRSVVQCELLTGRTHQIRVHLAALGYPIVGDRVYAEPDAAAPRQALHAWRVSLPDPVTRATLEFESAVPQDLRYLITELS